jgi:hypothetical protein
MILESLIKDDQRVTFDCCKATISKGGIVEIPDIYYSSAEVRGAIKLGLVRLVGAEPMAAPSELTVIKKTRYRNRSPHLLTFECVKGSVPKGGFIDIPDNLMHEREIQNALAWNMLENVDNPRPVIEAGPPAVLEEISVGDVELATQVIPTTSQQPKRLSTPPTPIQVPAAARPRPRRAGGARPISRSSDREGGDLYSESQVRDVRATRRNVAGSSAAPIEIDVNSSEPASGSPEISFDDIFEGQ